MSDVDDGSDKPMGHQTEDGELEVRLGADGQPEYSETELGQYQRWMRQAPDLYERYQVLLSASREAEEEPPYCEECDDIRQILGADMRFQPTHAPLPEPREPLGEVALGCYGLVQEARRLRERAEATEKDQRPMTPQLALQVFLYVLLRDSDVTEAFVQKIIVEHVEKGRGKAAVFSNTELAHRAEVLARRVLYGEAAPRAPAMSETNLAYPIIAYRVEPLAADERSQGDGEWHILTFQDGRQRHILTRTPTIDVDAQKH